MPLAAKTHETCTQAHSKWTPRGKLNADHLEPRPIQTANSQQAAGVPGANET